MHTTPESNKDLVQSFEIILENKVLHYKQVIIIASAVCESTNICRLQKDFKFSTLIFVKSF